VDNRRSRALGLGKGLRSPDPFIQIGNLGLEGGELGVFIRADGFAAAAGHWGHSGQAAQGVMISPAQRLPDLGEQHGEDGPIPPLALSRIGKGAHFRNCGCTPLP
jgi:hypothetical protein